MSISDTKIKREQQRNAEMDQELQSDMKDDRKQITKKNIYTYGVVVLFCIFGTRIYEQFS